MAFVVGTSPRASRVIVSGRLELVCLGGYNIQCAKMTMKGKPSESLFALFIENSECDDLEKRKIYQILPDAEAAQEGYLRVVDESRQGYLYPAAYFILVELPRKAQEALTATT